jgi:cobalt-precorrin 5A hydrolase/precorrin-3B C17-methyltransferase
MSMDRDQIKGVASVAQNPTPIAAIATTLAGVQALLPLCEADIHLWVSEHLAEQVEQFGRQEHIYYYSGYLRVQLSKLWGHYQGLVFCLATGAVVRLVAPLLQDKTADPAVVVVDEAKRFVISVLGGHQGGADRLAQWVALQLSATAVLTGSANALGIPGIDILGLPFGWVRGIGDWTAVSAAMAHHQLIEVRQDAGSTLWQKHLPPAHPFHFVAVGQDSAREQLQPQLWITATQPMAGLSSSAAMPQVYWHPRVLWVGLGCERGTPRKVIEAAVQQVFQTYQLAEAAIAGMATLDLKADEVGLLDLCRDRRYPLQCFKAEELRLIAIPNPSAVVEAEVGTPSVAEAAALLAAAQQNQHSSVTSPPATSPPADLPALLVTKQIFRLPEAPGAVTIAIAQSTQEYIGRTGNLWLVGTGPGALNQITPAAQAAIAQADVVIGYSLYVDLVRPLVRPGQIIESLPITQELQRAQRAIALARWGLTVAVISSGDCGIYGMAGLVLEELKRQGWDGQVPAVQVLPGITALQAAASRLGGPLMHDFCAISLSDLLTPWTVIEQRLLAAAQADFVVALYNPRSQTRTEQISMAQRIFLQYRDPKTPVAIVRSAYRKQEQVTLTTLDTMLDVAIDMLTTVLIGNQSSFVHHQWMITPRGYLGGSWGR